MPQEIPSKKFNINTATVKELQSIPGIGPTLAQREAQWRRTHDWFKSFEDLKQIRGIGEKRIARMRPYIVFTDAEATELGVALPASAADALVLYDQTWGLFDVSYAAAWELGRMLTLQNGRLAVQLFNWKRSHADALRSARHLADYGYDFPVKQQGQTVAGPNGSFPDAFARWLNELTLLRHIPFNYLVPDERLLPPESLRFFTVDRVWLECLRDGAFSIGRVLEYDLNQDTGHFTRLTPMPPLSGLLIRSAVVAGWPGLHVEAYSKAPDNPEAPHPEAGTRCTTVRMERLSKNVLLCLFTGTPQHGNQHGEVRMVDIHLKPETLHFGLDTPDAAHINEDDPTCLVKKLRSTDGTPLDEQVPETGKAPWIDSDTRVVDFVSLAKKIYQKLPTSRAGAPDADAFAADFALQMVAGVDLVRFIR